jgi:hypothetical protein
LKNLYLVAFLFRFCFPHCFFIVHYIEFNRFKISTLENWKEKKKWKIKMFIFWNLKNNGRTKEKRVNNTLLRVGVLKSKYLYLVISKTAVLFFLSLFVLFLFAFLLLVFIYYFEVIFSFFFVCFNQSFQISILYNHKKYKKNSIRLFSCFILCRWWWILFLPRS